MPRKTKKQIEAEKEAMAAAKVQEEITEQEEQDAIAEAAQKTADSVDAEVTEDIISGKIVLPNMTMELIKLGMESEATSATKWSKTGDVIVQNQDLFTGDVNPKNFQKNFTGAMDDEVIIQDLPTEGNLDRKGDPLNIIKTNGKVKWSSWNVTSRIMQNCSDIWKVLELVPFKVIFPDGKIISRYEVLQLIEKHSDPKVPETAIETILRCNELILKKVGELELKDIDTAISSMSIVQAAISDAHDLLSS